jgi:diadenosine tetraphosphate (Ap4A) HIT family hydrolase
MERERVPFDVSRLTRKDPSCFICDIVAGNPRREHHIVAETESAIAFLNRFPTLFGYVLVAPKLHREQVTGDFDEKEYLELQRLIFRITECMRRLLVPERIYILSLGSQEGNSHVHWHVAPLPRGVPREQQQYHALMHENGVLETTPEEMAQFAEQLRTAVRG